MLRHRLLLAAAAFACACATPIDDDAPAPAATDAGVATDDAGVRDADDDAGATTRDDAGANAGDAGTPGGDAGVPGGGDAGSIGVVDAGLSAAQCFAGIQSQTGVAPNYDPYAPVLGSHCQGTNHQSITDIERVVFLGDSVTVGTPPTESADTYRALLADMLAERFGLEAPSALWKSVNPLDGVATIKNSGDFWSCAKWGARDDDLIVDGTQIFDCFPEEERGKKTLVVMTMGGNDIASITKDGSEGAPLAEVTANMESAIADFRLAIETLKDPAVFPGGVDIVFTNNFEFTDGSGDVESCPAASAAGFGEPWEDPTALATLVVHMMEQYMAIAVETGSDMLFVLETFCGHGYHNDDASNGCYRGPDTPRWFDVSCIHPNPEGHAALAQMFMNVVDE